MTTKHHSGKIDLKKCPRPVPKFQSGVVLCIGMVQVDRRTELKLKKKVSRMEENDPSQSSLRDTIRARALGKYLNQDITTLSPSPVQGLLGPPDHLHYYFNNNAIKTIVKNAELDGSIGKIYVDYIRMPSAYLKPILSQMFPTLSRYEYRVEEKGPIPALLAANLLTEDVEIYVPHVRTHNIPFDDIEYKYKTKGARKWKVAVFRVEPIQAEQNSLACASDLVGDMYMMGDTNQNWLQRLDRKAPFLRLKRIS
jgi:hypothetical protein